MGDVLEYLVDGTSGLVTGSVAGCIVTGICSKGEPGKAYLLGNRSNLEEILGRGELVTKIKDIFLAGGQNPQVIAVPVRPTKDGSISSVTKSNSAESIIVTGKPLTASGYVLTIVSSGVANIATYKLSIDGSDYEIRTIPADKVLKIDGITIGFTDGEYKAGDIYSFTTQAPEASINAVMEALEKPLELYDTEFIYITGASDSVAWAAAQAKADELFNLHRPTYFKLEARLPKADEKIDDWVSALLAEKKHFAGRFVQVCASFGEITDSGGKRQMRNMAGLQAGRTLAIPVQRAHGRVKDGNITGATLPIAWSDTIQETLEKAGYNTAKNYSGLNGAYWGDSRTMADSTSDFQYEEVVRVTFKGLRLSRQAALKSMYDELGDPLNPADMTGAIYLQTSIENALSTMTSAVPKEMADYKVVIPEGQDFINNGVALEITFIGIPIIRQIKLFANYAYAGSRFDPRLL